MAAPQTPPTGSPLEDIQDEILDRLHAGDAIERAQWVARHPEHAEALGRFFQILDVLEVPPDAASGRPVRLGEYEIGPEIGRGGMGVVYRALQMPLNRPVALKILPPALRQDRRLLKRFQRESAAAGRLRHPNIVPVYSVGEAGGAPFFAMELVEGCSLADLLRRWRAEHGTGDGTGESTGDATGTDSVANEPTAAASSHVVTFPERLPQSAAERVPWAVSLMARVLDALDYAHNEGIVHRDVKPGNILMEADGTPRLTDFGLALDLAASELTITGEVFGSPLYMSPEQAFRRETPVDARTDIYSVAVTLYELLALRLPYPDLSRNALMSALGDGTLTPLREAAPDAPPALEAVLHKAMSHEPGDRFRRASDFATALRESLEHPDALPRGVPKLVLSKPGRGRKRAWMASHPVGTAFLVLVGLILMIPVIGLILALLFALMPAMGVPVATGPTPQQLEALADGTLANDEELMADWFQPSLHVRSVVARDAPGMCEVRYRFSGPSMPPDLWVGVRVMVDVEGEERGPEGFMFTSSEFGQDDQGEVLHLSGIMPLPLADLLEGYLDRQLVSIRVRATLRIQHRTGASQTAEFVGTEREVVFDERTLIIYDSYPDDYPIAISDPVTNAAMLLAYTPVSVRPINWENGGDTEPLLLLTFAETPHGPEPGCFELDLLGPTGQSTLAVAQGSFAYAWPDSGTGSGRGSGTKAFQERFVPVEGLSPEDRQYLDAVKAGQTDSVQLRFRSSREAALRHPDVEHYWSGSFAVEVPVVL